MASTPQIKSRNHFGNFGEVLMWSWCTGNESRAKATFCTTFAALSCMQSFLLRCLHNDHHTLCKGWLLVLFARRVTRDCADLLVAESSKRVLKLARSFCAVFMQKACKVDPRSTAVLARICRLSFPVKRQKKKRCLTTRERETERVERHWRNN